MRNKKWAKKWKSYIRGLGGLEFIPSEEDSRRVRALAAELSDIVDRNMEASE